MKKIIFYFLLTILILSTFKVYAFQMTNDILNIDFSPSTTNLIYDLNNALIVSSSNPPYLLLDSSSSMFKITNITIDKSKGEVFSKLIINCSLTPSTTLSVYIVNGRNLSIIETLYITSDQNNFIADLKKIIPKEIDNIYFIFVSSTSSPTGGKVNSIIITKESSVDALLREDDITIFPNPYAQNPPKDLPSISIKLSRISTVSIIVFDSIGNVVRIITKDSNLPEGIHSFTWDMKNDKGEDVPSGNYIIFAKINDKNVSKRFLLIRY
ncbi:MAG: FlgD immunoglobulin-like domain containing protein [Brevinematia bacterium]